MAVSATDVVGRTELEAFVCISVSLETAAIKRKTYPYLLSVFDEKHFHFSFMEMLIESAHKVPTTLLQNSPESSFQSTSSSSIASHPVCHAT
jgi:hypothetical protein